MRPPPLPPPPSVKVCHIEPYPTPSECDVISEWPLSPPIGGSKRHFANNAGCLLIDWLIDLPGRKPGDNFTSMLFWYRRPVPCQSHHRINVQQTIAEVMTYCQQTTPTLLPLTGCCTIIESDWHNHGVFHDNKMPARFVDFLAPRDNVQCTFKKQCSLVEIIMISVSFRTSINHYFNR